MFQNKVELHSKGKSLKDFQAPTGVNEVDQWKQTNNNYTVRELDDEYVLLEQENGDNNFMSIVFKREPGSEVLKVIAIGTDDSFYPAELVNYSYSYKKGASSYLLYSVTGPNDKPDKNLIRLDFSNRLKTEKYLGNTDKKYEYLWGPGLSLIHI